ncbi:beta-ketoacyl-[acyl-carrier-protein] synthase family protein [Paraburkholderia terricola]|uniref:3-oxoacyl-[acyl-carrier-protein] synthase II n=1 Tax=Paraburkholderia terricola TaxID=169427 RepID=A0ABU1M1G1_9BURK|nr:beta-ketoacyl-[acyl-carrier-protein] synthase family protein [Paraburkholderia terricola]MDR6412833.1 3-oxoacyl-[acyl-carrier-protein] synthase II [Paraburkholderia terricola]MDR6450041.1 3-oxoacyl-[acyl-carrier-protein] synthase II [Paraburkholderia terricola]MDR6484895.1 3-oxoacyl-[acyl-carrier-protein] synthase II [Paraburkholderia terricola]
MRRVVITGIGVLSSIGNTFDELADSIRHGRSGVAPIASMDVTGLAGRLGCEVRGVDIPMHFPAGTSRRMDRSTQYAVIAARQAAAMANWRPTDTEPRRTGVVIGTTIGGLLLGTRYYEYQHRRGRHCAGMLSDYLLYSAGARIVREFGLEGPNIAFSTACSSSNVALGHAADLVRHGRLDTAFVGGVDTMAKTTVAGFNALRNVARETMRPFDKNRTGLVLGEGAAIFCIETEDSARGRGARVLAEILGYGMSTDAYHMTAPDATGRGPALAMTRALAQSGIERADVEYINAHGTATRHNDEVETRAIKKVFGASAATIPVSSTKPMHGHMLGATGAIEAAAIIAAMRDGYFPPTINYRDADPRCDLDYVPNEARLGRFTTALSNNFGFGGNNCALVLRSAF